MTCSTLLKERFRAGCISQIGVLTYTFKCQIWKKIRDVSFVVDQITIDLVVKRFFFKFQKIKISQCFLQTPFSIQNYRTKHHSDVAFIRPVRNFSRFFFITRTPLAFLEPLPCFLNIWQNNGVTNYERASAASERSLFNITEKSQYERPGPGRPDPARPEMLLRGLYLSNC